jgi:hypothetical protein
VTQGVRYSVTPTAATHRLGDTIDAVIARADTAGPAVRVVDADLSDQRLLEWSVETEGVQRPADVVIARPWRSLDLEQFRIDIVASRICQPDAWPDSVDEMAVLFETEIGAVLDRHIPVRHFTRRSRPSDPWFDKECSDSKRLTRRLRRPSVAAVRSVSASCSSFTAAADAGDDCVETPLHSTAADVADGAWRAQRRCYRELLNRKRSEF